MVISLSDVAKCKIMYFRSARWMAAGNINTFRVNVNVASLRPQWWWSKSCSNDEVVMYYLKSFSIPKLSLLQKLHLCYLCSLGWETTARDSPLIWNRSGRQLMQIAVKSIHSCMTQRNPQSIFTCITNHVSFLAFSFFPSSMSLCGVMGLRGRENDEEEASVRCRFLKAEKINSQ